METLTGFHVIYFMDEEGGEEACLLCIYVFLIHVSITSSFLSNTKEHKGSLQLAYTAERCNKGTVKSAGVTGVFTEGQE